MSDEIAKRTPEITGLTYEETLREERRSTVWSLKVRGLSTTAIAKHLGVSVATVHKDLNEIAAAFKDELVKIDPVTLVAEHVNWLKAIERMALFEVAASQKQEKTIKDASGGEITVKVSDPNKPKFLAIAVEARRSQIKLLIDAGIIPKEPDKLFNALQEYEAKPEKETEDSVSEDQVKQSIFKLLRQGRVM